MAQLCLPLFSKFEVKKFRHRINARNCRRAHLERFRARDRLRRKNNRECARKSARQWCNNNPAPVGTLCLPFYPKREVERVQNNIRGKRWRLKHPYSDGDHRQRYHKSECNHARRRKYERQYFLKHPEQANLYAKKHPEKYREYTRLWAKRHPEKCKEREAKRRALGFIPLNQSFEGSHAHHVDRLHIIYVPEKLHRSIYHNVWNGHGMKQINAKVFEWLSQQSKTVPLLEVMSVATS